MKMKFRKVSSVSLLKASIHGTTGNCEAHSAPLQYIHGIPERLTELFLITYCWGRQSMSAINSIYKWSSTAHCSFEMENVCFSIKADTPTKTNEDEKCGWYI